MTRIVRCLVLSCLMAIVGAACTPKPKVKPCAPDRIRAGEGNRDYYAGTSAMQTRIRDAIARLPCVDSKERMRLGREIVAYGEPAVPQLVAALDSSSAEMRSAAAWLLGFTKDPRTSVRLVAALEDPVAHVRYEAAASLVKLQDNRGLDTIVDGLEDRDAMVRSKCALLLEDVTGEDLGYRADLAPDERAAAVARWRAWAGEKQRTDG